MKTKAIAAVKSNHQSRPRINSRSEFIGIPQVLRPPGCSIPTLGDRPHDQLVLARRNKRWQYGHTPFVRYSCTRQKPNCAPSARRVRCCARWRPETVRLADLGTDRNEAHRWQLAAEMPDAEFEEWIAAQPEFAGLTPQGLEKHHCKDESNSGQQEKDQQVKNFRYPRWLGWVSTLRIHATKASAGGLNYHHCQHDSACRYEPTAYIHYEFYVAAQFRPQSMAPWNRNFVSDWHGRGNACRRLTFRVILT